MTYDVAVVGAGVVGCAIARALSVGGARVLLLERANDVGTGTSKANTAILHTGFDAAEGTIEARLLRRGQSLLRRYAQDRGVPHVASGALMLAWDEPELRALSTAEAKAVAVGYHATSIVDAADVYALEPDLGPGALGALVVPDEDLVCPWTLTVSLATEAVARGCDLRLGCAVEEIERDGGFRLRTTGGAFTAGALVNAAGLHSDVVDRMAGHDDIRIRPRRGELIVFDKLARPLVRHILLPVPSPHTKGMIVAPTVYGNLLAGPTAEEIDDPDASETTADGLAAVMAHARRVVPALAECEITATYAGVRAATDERDYQLRTFADERYVRVAGIRSTGVSACLGIAEHVAQELAALGVGGGEEGGTPLPVPPIGEDQRRPFADPAAIAADPAYGEIVCFCERVTAGEIRDALTAPVPAHDLGGISRRTRATNGRCQGFHCLHRVEAMLGEIGVPS